MPKDRLVTEQDIDAASVRLPSLFGLSPGRWLAAAAALLLAGLAFSVLVLPGILRPGTRFRFSSAPTGAAVFLDGAYAGTTPCEVFVPEGRRDIRVSSPGFREEDLSRIVDKRLFASAFLPRTEAVEARLTLEDGEGLWRGAVREFSEWCLAGEPTAVWQAPPVLESAAAARFTDPTASAPSWEERRDFVLAAARLINHSSAARELVRAASLAFGSGKPDSPAATDGWKQILLEEPGLAGLLGELAQKESESLPGMAERTTARTAVSAVPSEITAAGAALAPVTLRSVRFLPVPGAGRRLLAETETTAGQYAAFLRDRPEWGADRLERLISEGLVTGDYLAGFENALPDEPVRGVSWHAARAYTVWLSGSAPAGFRASLPSEALWETASRSGGEKGPRIWADGVRTGPAPASGRIRDGAGFADLLGNLWEWCDDSFAFRPDIGADAALRFPGSERSVRGGSWASPEGTVTALTRGSFPPEWCSPFLGFRPALTADGRGD